MVRDAHEAPPVADEIITTTIDLPSSLLFQRIRVLGRVLGLGIAIDGKAFSLSLDASASDRSPGYRRARARGSRGRRRLPAPVAHDPPALEHEHRGSVERGAQIRRAFRQREDREVGDRARSQAAERWQAEQRGGVAGRGA